MGSFERKNSQIGWGEENLPPRRPAARCSRSEPLRLADRATGREPAGAAASPENQPPSSRDGSDEYRSPTIWTRGPPTPSQTPQPQPPPPPPVLLPDQPEGRLPPSAAQTHRIRYRNTRIANRTAAEVATPGQNRVKRAGSTACVLFSRSVAAAAARTVSGARKDRHIKGTDFRRRLPK